MILPCRLSLDEAKSLSYLSRRSHRFVRSILAASAWQGPDLMTASHINISPTPESAPGYCVRTYVRSHKLADPIVYSGRSVFLHVMEEWKTLQVCESSQ